MPDVETELPELNEGAFDDEDEDDGGDDDGGDDDGGDDMAEVEAYASAGPQRWWKGGGGAAGSTSVRVAPPRARTGGKFGDWFERTWWKMSQEAFNSAILGRPNPASLPFKIETFRCDVSKLASNAITLVTQCSVDRLPQLEAQARAWNGPISVAIFVKSPDTDLPSIANLHARLLESTNAAMEITLVHALEDDEDFTEYDTLYPINTLVRPASPRAMRCLALIDAAFVWQRNIAVDHARTDLLFLLDVDFVPSRKLRKLCKTQLWTADVAQQASSGCLTVVPAFEVIDTIPTEQDEIFAQLKAGTAEPFHVSRFAKGHQPTDFGAAPLINHRRPFD